MAPAERLLKTAEVAAITGYQPSTIREMCRDGRLPAFKVGPEFRIKESDLDRLIGTRRQSPTANHPEIFADLAADGEYTDNLHAFAVRPYGDGVELFIGTGTPNQCYVTIGPEATAELIAALLEAREGRVKSRRGDCYITMGGSLPRNPTPEDLEAAKARAKEVAKRYAPKPHDLEALSRDELVGKVQAYGFGDGGFDWLRKVVEAGGGKFEKLKPEHMINALRNPDQFR